MWRPRFDAGVSDWFIMSSVVGSTPWAMTTLPAGAAAAPSGTSRVRARATRVRRRVIARLLGIEGDRSPSSSGKSSGRVPDNLGVRRQRVKVGERLVACLQPSERLSLSHPRERPADRGTGGEAEPVHDVLAPEERRRRLDRLQLLPAAEEVADQQRAPPDTPRRGAGHRGRVGQREQQQVLRVLAQVAIEAGARAVRQPPRGAEVHRTQVVAHEALEHPERPLGQAQPSADRAGALGADHVVVEEPHATLDQAPRLGLGHVVEERAELEHLAARDATAERLVHVRAELLAERHQRGETREHAVGRGQSAQRVLEDGEAVRRGLGRRAHRLHLGEEDAEQPERVHAPEGARRVGKCEHQEQLVPHALGGDRGQRRCDRPDRRDRPPRQPEAERRLQAHAAERAQGVVGEHAEVRRPQTARAEIGEASGGIHDRRAAPDEQLAQSNREGVDGEVAGREVRRERGAAEVGDVEADAREHHTPRPALGVEGDEGAANPLRHPPREVERPRGDRDVEVDLAPRPTSEPGVTHRPAHEHGGAPATREGGDRPHDRDLGARQPLALKNGHGRVSTLLTHDSSRRTAVALKLRKVDYTKKGHLAYVTIRNAEHENCLAEEVDHDLWKVWHDFRDDPGLYVAILTGEGTKSFCAGSDLRAYVERIANRSPEWNRRRAHEGPNLGGITKGIAVWKPIIAAINGYCLAGGMELAMACDIRIAADHARFGVVNRRWNVGAESGLTQRLTHIVGLGVALDLLITGRWFDAREAYRIHFVNRVVRRARLMAEDRKLAEQICEYPQSSLRTDKEACIRGLGLTLEEGLRLENTLWNTNLALPDTLNGPRAFIEKRRFVPTQEV